MRVCRELTKRHETVYAGKFSEVLTYYRAQEPKGECVLVIAGKSRQELKEEAIAEWEMLSVPAHMEYYEKQGLGRKEAMKQVAKDRGVGKREIYQALLEAD